MTWETIRKHAQDSAGANLRNYDAEVNAFTWAQARALLKGPPGGGLNIVHEAIDRHVQAGRGKKLALRWLGRDESIRDFTYAALASPICWRGTGSQEAKPYSRCLAASPSFTSSRSEH
jgi:acetyl-CoA synthetase